MIICAAIKIQFQHNQYQTIEAVIPGLRHSDCRDLMSTLAVPLHRQETDGFITHTGAFLDRYDAFEHALMCGQLSDTTRVVKAEQGERQLYSEDLY